MSRSDGPEADQTIVEHLGELRNRLLYSIYGLIPAFALCWWRIEDIFRAVTGPVLKFLPGGKVFFTGPTDMFMAHLQIAVVASVLLTCPWWLYQVWRFVAPGLYRNEKRFATLFMFAGTFLFLGGAAFAYFLVYPMAFGFLFNFAGDVSSPMITIDHYLSFFVSTTLVFGVCFELPLVLAILGMLGVIDKKFLREKRRYAVVAIATVCAVVTPPDLLSMLALLAPMMLLYELGIVVVGFLQPKPQPETSLTEI